MTSFVLTAMAVAVLVEKIFPTMFAVGICIIVGVWLARL